MHLSLYTMVLCKVLYRTKSIDPTLTILSILRSNALISIVKIVTVNFPDPPRFITSPTSVDVFASEEEVRFECKASGDPPPTLTWRKDGAILSRAGRHVVLGDGILTIAHPSQSDEGIYECVAENEAGQVVSQAALTFYEEAGRRACFI